MNESEVTLAELGRKLDDIHKDLREHLEDDKKLFHGTNSNPGLIVTVDRLNQIANNRKWYFRALWTAIIGLFADRVLTHFLK